MLTGALDNTHKANKHIIPVALEAAGGAVGDNGLLEVVALVRISDEVTECQRSA